MTRTRVGYYKVFTFHDKRLDARLCASAGCSSRYRHKRFDSHPLPRHRSIRSRIYWVRSLNIAASLMAPNILDSSVIGLCETRETYLKHSHVVEFKWTFVIEACSKSIYTNAFVLPSFFLVGAERERQITPRGMRVCDIN